MIGKPSEKNMSKRILDLEFRQHEARAERDEAIREYRILCARTTRTIQLVASAFVEDFRLESKLRQDRVKDGSSLEGYLDWLLLASELRIREFCRYMEGNSRHLALAELRLLIASHNVSALDKELARLHRQEVWQTELLISA
jgi:hypothetical protein